MKLAIDFTVEKNIAKAHTVLIAAALAAFDAAEEALYTTDTSIKHEGYKHSFATNNDILGFSVASERHNAHNKYYHSKIYKANKHDKTPAPHKLTVNYIY